MGSICFCFGKDPASPPRTIINSVQPAMAVEERPDDSLDADQCPGFDLSISEICHALKIKLAQTRDSRYACTATRPLLFDN